MKVALCFFGQPRHIENPHTWLSHKYWIIDKYQSDVFAHSWISGEEKTFEYSDWVNPNDFTIENKNSVDLILKKYNPKKYIFEQPINFSLDEGYRIILKERQLKYQQTHDGTFNYSLNNENNTLSQLYSVSKSISLLDDNYDWVILSRYDNQIFNFPNLYQLENDNLYLDNKYPYNFSDILIFGGQNQIETLNCFNQIPELFEDIKYFTPEEFKRVAYQKVYKPNIAQTVYEYQSGQEKRILIDVKIVEQILKNYFLIEIFVIYL